MVVSCDWSRQRRCAKLAPLPSRHLFTCNFWPSRFSPCPQHPIGVLRIWGPLPLLKGRSTSLLDACYVLGFCAGMLDRRVCHVKKGVKHTQLGIFASCNFYEFGPALPPRLPPAEALLGASPASLASPGLRPSGARVVASKLISSTSTRRGKRNNFKINSQSRERGRLQPKAQELSVVHDPCGSTSSTANVFDLNLLFSGR